MGNSKDSQSRNYLQFEMLAEFKTACEICSGYMLRAKGSGIIVI